ncbi:MAG: hypothetical protein J6P16_05355 [Eubacterium sp.]|nr:hypothetical protein [Eubacterium sp.]
MHVRDEDKTAEQTGTETPDSEKRDYGGEFGRRRGSKERTRIVAELSIMAAVSVVLLILGTVISVNTLFFTAIAAFLTGLAVIRHGFGAGVMLFIGCALLDFLLNPIKTHVFLYLFMGGFIILSEGSYKPVQKLISDQKKINALHFVIRLLIFYAGYLPVILFLPRLFLGEQALKWLFDYDWSIWVMIGGGVVAFLVYEIAYVFAKRAYLNFFIRART